MSEDTKHTSPGVKRPDESLTESIDSKLGEVVNVLKGIDEKIELILRAVREINRRG